MLQAYCAMHSCTCRTKRPATDNSSCWALLAPSKQNVSHKNSCGVAIVHTSPTRAAVNNPRQRIAGNSWRPCKQALVLIQLSKICSVKGRSGCSRDPETKQRLRVFQQLCEIHTDVFPIHAANNLHVSVSLHCLAFLQHTVHVRPENSASVESHACLFLCIAVVEQDRRKMYGVLRCFPLLLQGHLLGRRPPAFERF
jgi:hypothetical protein